MALDVAEHALAEGEIGRALVGEAERTRRAVQQPRAEPRFKIADVTRHQRARQTELARGYSEGAGAHHAHEALHGAELVQALISSFYATILCRFSGLCALMSKPILALRGWAALAILAISACKLATTSAGQWRVSRGRKRLAGPHRPARLIAMADQKPARAAADIAALDRPVPAGVNAASFGSDVVADAMRALDIPYIALNPGASYRGLHDSLVNYLGNERPQMLLCLHEEAAIAIAHGWAKVTGKAMAAAVHSNVGLMHGTMAFFNAWCDRMPMVVLGATGPVDSTKRRPWIDWIHTARDQGALVRGYTKWDDQPASPTAAREAVLRANWIANTTPRGPTYVNLDAEMQESKLQDAVPPIDTKRYMPPVAGAAPAATIKQAADLLRGAKQPVILAGRTSRDVEAW